MSDDQITLVYMVIGKSYGIFFYVFLHLSCSLNKTKRQRELLRVTHENQAILKRISSKEPHYNHLQWHEEWRVGDVMLPSRHYGDLSDGGTSLTT